jgi:hypothetical protein
MYCTFDGFERALAEQAAHFEAWHPDVEVQTEHQRPEDLYARMIAQGGVRN